MKKLNNQLYAVTEDELQNMPSYDNNNLYVTDAEVKDGKLKKAGKISNGDKETVAEDLPEIAVVEEITSPEYAYGVGTGIEVGYWRTFIFPVGPAKVTVGTISGRIYTIPISYTAILKKGISGEYTADEDTYEAVLKEDYVVRETRDLAEDFSGDNRMAYATVPISYWELTPVE